MTLWTLFMFALFRGGIVKDCFIMLRRFDAECNTTFRVQFHDHCKNLKTVHEYRSVYYKVQHLAESCYIM